MRSEHAHYCTMITEVLCIDAQGDAFEGLADDVHVVCGLGLVTLLPTVAGGEKASEHECPYVSYDRLLCVRLSAQ